MSVLIALWFAVITYAALFIVLFENREEFAEQFESFVAYFPVSFVMDHFMNFNRKRYSYRIAVWLPSGIFAGIISYFLLF